MDNSNLSVKETKKYLIFNYQDSNQANNLLNDWYRDNRLIIMDKRDEDIIIKLEKDNYVLVDNDVLLDDELNEIIDLLEIGNNIRVRISQKDIKLYSDYYKEVFNQFFVKDGNCYLFNFDRKEELYEEIIKYNRIFGVIGHKKVDKVFKKFFVEDIKEVMDKGFNNIAFANKGDRIELYLDSDINYLFIFDDKIMFNNIYFPEIVKVYIMKESGCFVDYDKQYLSINDNFHMINFIGRDLEGYYKFIKDLDDSNNYHIDLKSDYVFIKRNDEANYNYSYGYVSILLISLILSLITIVVLFICRLT